MSVWKFLSSSSLDANASNIGTKWEDSRPLLVAGYLFLQLQPRFLLSY